MSGSTEKIEHAVEIMALRMTTMRSSLIATTVCCVLACAYATASLVMTLIHTDKINDMQFDSRMRELDIRQLKYMADEAEKKLDKLLSLIPETIPKTPEVHTDSDDDDDEICSNLEELIMESL